MAQPIDSTSVNVTWDPPDRGNFDGFYLQARNASGVVNETRVGNERNTAVLGGLVPGSLFNITVQSIFVDVESNETTAAEPVATCKF